METIIDFINQKFDDPFLGRLALDSYSSDKIFKTINKLDKIDVNFLVRKNKIDKLIDNHSNEFEDFSHTNPYFSGLPLSITPKIAKRIINGYRKLIIINNSSPNIIPDYRLFIPSLTLLAQNEKYTLFLSQGGFFILLPRYFIFVPELFVNFKNEFKIYNSNEISSNQIINKFNLKNTSCPFSNFIKTYKGYDIIQFFDFYLAVKLTTRSFTVLNDNPFENRDSFYSDNLNDLTKIIDLKREFIYEGSSINNDKIQITNNFLNTKSKLVFEKNKFVLKNQTESIKSISSLNTIISYFNKIIF